MESTAKIDLEEKEIEDLLKEIDNKDEDGDLTDDGW